MNYKIRFLSALTLCSLSNTVRAADSGDVPLATSTRAAASGVEYDPGAPYECQYHGPCGDPPYSEYYGCTHLSDGYVDTCDSCRGFVTCLDPSTFQPWPDEITMPCTLPGQRQPGDACVVPIVLEHGTDGS